MRGSVAPQRNAVKTTQKVPAAKTILPETKEKMESFKESIKEKESLV